MTWLCERAERKNWLQRTTRQLKRRMKIKHQQMQNTYGDVSFKLTDMIMGFKPHTITQ